MKTDRDETTEESEGHAKISRTRFARLFPDGGLIVMPPGTDWFQARRELIESYDDDNIEIIEIEITVVRSHGKPKLALVTEFPVSCPTCGEEFYVERECDGDK